jgi:hypothetical protein
VLASVHVSYRERAVEVHAIRACMPSFSSLQMTPGRAIDPLATIISQFPHSTLAHVTPRFAPPRPSLLCPAFSQAIFHDPLTYCAISCRPISYHTNQPTSRIISHRTERTVPCHRVCRSASVSWSPYARCSQSMPSKLSLTRPSKASGTTLSLPVARAQGSSQRLST